MDENFLILKGLLNDLTETLRIDNLDFGTRQLASMGMISSITPSTDSPRYRSSGKVNHTIIFDFETVRDAVSIQILKYPITKEIFNHIASNGFWLDELGSYEDEQSLTPSIISKFIAGFITRIYQINNWSFLFSELAFNKAFDELESFVKHPDIEVQYVYNCKGIVGEIPMMKISSNSCLRKCSEEESLTFNTTFFENKNVPYREIYVSDYVYSIDFKRPKDIYKRTNFKLFYSNINKEKSQIQKDLDILMLSIPDFIRPRNYIVISKSWITDVLWSSGHYTRDWRNFRNKVIDETTAIALTETAKIFDHIDYLKVDDHFLFALERYRRYKKAQSHDDQVVELAIAYECLFKNSATEIHLQLRLKMIQLLNNIVDPKIVFKDLGQFYKIRSLLLHGDAKSNNSDKELIIKTFAGYLANALVKILVLSQEYTYNQIQEALDIGMFMNDTIENILISLKVKTPH